MEILADVVVVGGASAGLAAAVAAAQAGAERVVVLEKAKPDSIGGNARFSHTGFRFVHGGTDDLLQLLPADGRAGHTRTRVAPYSAEDFMADLERVTRGRIDGELARVLVEDSREAIDWMASLGHRWQFRHNPVEVDGYLYHNPGSAVGPVGGGLGQVEHWIEIGEELGVELRTDSAVTAILGDHRRVEGVRVRGPEGRYEIVAEAVVLASGGFQASPERRARYLGGNADLMRVRGSRHDTGEVLEMAIGLGAKTSGHWRGAHATPVDVDSAQEEMAYGANRYGYQFGITVNSEGRRFFDEGEAHYSYTYAKTGWAVLGQEDGVAYQIFDQKTVGLLPGHYRNQAPVEASTIPELAVGLGMEPAILEDTVARFNDAICDDAPFDAQREDGRGTQGLSVRRSNWAQALDDPPFVAYGVTGGITFSFGGLRVNRSAQVLNSHDDPIKGLYANGDIVGLFYHNYPSCSGQTRNAVFGGRSGAGAAGIG